MILHKFASFAALINIISPMKMEFFIKIVVPSRTVHTGNIYVENVERARNNDRYNI